MGHRTPTRRALLRSSAAITAGALIAGCTSTDDGEDVITVGTVYPRTGPYAQMAADSETSVEMAVDTINSDGGINGKQVEIVNRDSQLDPNEAIQVTQELINAENVDLLMGPVSSPVTEAMAGLARDHEVPLFNTDSASESLTGADCSEYLFRFRSTTEQEAIPFGPWLYENVGDTMCVYYSDYAWGESGLEDYGGEFERAGGEVIDSVAVPMGTAEQSNYLSQIDTDADILFPVLGGSDAASFLEQAGDFGLFDEMNIAGPGGDFVGGNEDADYEDGMVFIFSSMARAEGRWDRPNVQDFVNEFDERGGNLPSIQAARTYAMANQVFDSAEDCGFESRGDAGDLINELRGREFNEEEYITSNAQVRPDNHQVVYDQVVMEYDGGRFVELEDFSLSEYNDTETECSF